MTVSAPRGPQFQRAGALEAVESVGPLEIRIQIAEATAERAERWAKRAEALAVWLVAEWQCEQRKELA